MIPVEYRSSQWDVNLHNEEDGNCYNVTQDVLALTIKAIYSNFASRPNKRSSDTSCVFSRWLGCFQ